MNYNRKDYSDDELISLYRAILMPRMIEERMLVLLRQGKVSKWFSGIGQEAISVGSAMALEQEIPETLVRGALILVVRPEIQ